MGGEGETGGEEDTGADEEESSERGRVKAGGRRGTCTAALRAASVRSLPSWPGMRFTLYLNGREWKAMEGDGREWKVMEGEGR